MIPEAKKAAVEHALQLTFGVSEFEDIRALTAGLSSALIYRITALGKPYLLRIITRTDAISDPAHWYDCMKAAAEAGIAPHVWYTSLEDRVSITDFIEKKPFPISEARAKLPVLLKHLHSLPLFPNRLNYLDAIKGFILRLQSMKILPESLTTEVLNIFTEINSIYPRNQADQVSSHNDLKPENMLFDGDRVWLVDWEAAFLNDRYFDLAVVANFVVTNEDDEREYLRGYFDEEITDYHLARFFLMRQMLHISYFAAFMLFGSDPGVPIDLNLVRPGFREFNDGIWSGQITLENNKERQQYACVHLEQLRHNLGQKRFKNSMAIVSNYENK